jgi:C-terminal processing protease CtpA/Prc
MPRLPLPALRSAPTFRPRSLLAGAIIGASLGASLVGCTTPLGGARAVRVTPDALPVPAVVPGVSVSVLPPAPEPAAEASDSAGVARLLRLSYVWHLASLHHPAASVRGVPLDSAYIRAVTLVRSATTRELLEEAYGRFLAVLGDPLTRVEQEEGGGTALARTALAGTAPAGTALAGTAPISGALERVAVERTRDSILIVRMPTASRYEESAEVSVRAALESPPSRVVLDLRASRAADPDSVEAFVARTALAEQLAALPFTRSTVRVRRVGGSRVADGVWGVDDAWLVRDGGLVIPRASTPRRVMVLANGSTVLPRAVLGLIASARATLIAEGGVRDDMLVPSVRVAIGDGLAVRLRTGELVHADGSSGLVADTTVALSTAAAADSAPAMRTAMALLRAGRAPRAFRFPVVRAPSQLPGYYDGDPYPFMGARVLAAARIWSAMRARHAHRDLYDDDIDGIFARTIPAVERAGSARAYAAALLSQSASFDDAQAVLTGPSADSVRGVASLPFRVRFVDGRALINDVLNDPDVQSLGIERGQEVVAIDGFPLMAWLAEHRRDVSAPNDAARTDLLMRLLPRGPEGSVLLRLRDVNNRERQVTATRRERFVPLLPTVERPAQSATQMLPNGMVYLDLNRLTEQTVGDALAQHRAARAWMLDLRGALADSSTIGARVLAAVRTRDVAVIARELHRYQSAPCLVETLREATQQCPDERETRARLSRGDTASHFAGRLVALLDERTSGAMERLALALEATTDITFIGSATAGSPADAVPVRLPGQLGVQVPTLELRRIDGSPWQRVGISPVVDARLTARTVRTGGDDVIERAQQWVQQLDGSRRRR